MPSRPTPVPLRARAALFLVGAVAGTLGDQIHVQFHVLSYRAPVAWLLGQAIWVPLLFGCAGLALVGGERLYDGLRRPHEQRPSLASNAATVGLFYLAYLSTGLLQDSPLQLTAGLTAAWALRVARNPSRDRLLSAVAAATGGCLFEGLLSMTGAFTYRSPDFFHVPLWLPALYFHVSLMTRDIYLRYFAPRPASASPQPADARV